MHLARNSGAFEKNAHSKPAQSLLAMREMRIAAGGWQLAFRTVQRQRQVMQRVY